MAFLRRVLYLQAAVFFVAGLALAIGPRLVLVNLFSQLPLPDYGWVQIVGVQAVVLAMFMVLVAQRAEQVWWWSWTFVIVSAAVTVVAVLNALVGLGPSAVILGSPSRSFTGYAPLVPHRSSSVLWWLLAAVNAGFTVALLWGLGRTGQERPLP
jgi:hypothetical protein